MKRLLILLALAGVGSAFACSKDTTDEGDDDDDDTPTQDAGTDAARASDSAVRSDSGPVVVKVENPGGKCTKDGDCTGAMATCETELGEAPDEVELKDGYCTAMCASPAECGSNGGCPFAEITGGISFGFDLSMLLPIPSYCLDKCTATESNACRDGYECKSVYDFVPANIKQSFGAFLSGPGWRTTYCMPPIEINFPMPGLPDAGRPDAGGTGNTTAIGGMDAGR